MAAHGIHATRAPRREMGTRGSWGTRMFTRRPSGRAVTGWLAVGGCWAYARSRLGVTAPALVLVSQALNEVPKCVVIAAIAILVVRAVVAVLQEAAATFVALFSNDDVRASARYESWTASCSAMAEEPYEGSPVRRHKRARRRPFRPARTAQPDGARR